MTKSKKIGVCELCNREDIPLTFHHLIPKALHSKKWYKKTYAVDRLESGVDLCVDCHEAVHDFLTEKVLGDSFNTLELLASHPKVSKFVSWVWNQKKSRIKTRRANNR